MVPWTVLAGKTVPAAADTWGISGPTFLWLYLFAGLLAAAYGFTQRTRIVDATSAAPIAADALTPAETAMLFDNRRPVLAALAQLRGYQLIDSTGAPTRTPTEAENAALEPISRSLLGHLHTSPRRHMMQLALATGGEVRNLRRTLAKRGYMIGARQLRGFLLAALPLGAVLLLGLIRVIAGLANHKPVLYLVLAMIVLVILAGLVMRPSRLTRRGRLAAADAVRRFGHLRPGNRPAYSSYGPDSGSLAIALFGAAALWSLDPGLAGATGTLAGGSSGSDGSGSSCSTGGGDSGGSSCGGSSCGSSCGGGGGCGG
ncbi:TIGR04222 domain-containing membrane protein [Nocardia jejuensis]|uniref:TIGR04222 domain-containing membrane protein n=1 Tax=Nocardia jejuensis TaxID=328049 RepID=UPI0008332980|nr:TIGR04222 domain-containing membrane protein [Nocardia jejuensis]